MQNRIIFRKWLHRHSQSRIPASGKTSLLLVLLVLSATHAHTADIADSCAQLAQHASVKIIYTDLPMSEDHSHAAAALKALSGNTLGRQHNVYGLTYAKPKLDYEIRASFAESSRGKVCMAPDVTIKAGFTAMKIYLAQEIPDSCRKGIIREHELEHVATWKAHLRAGTRLMETPLRQAFAKSRVYESRSLAEQDLQPWVDEVVKPLKHQLFQHLINAQRAIDSPLSYGNVETRLRACPPTQGGKL